MNHAALPVNILKFKTDYFSHSKAWRISHIKYSSLFDILNRSTWWMQYFCVRLLYPFSFKCSAKCYNWFFLSSWLSSFSFFKANSFFRKECSRAGWPRIVSFGKICRTRRITSSVSGKDHTFSLWCHCLPSIPRIWSDFSKPNGNKIHRRSALQCQMTTIFVHSCIFRYFP